MEKNGLEVRRQLFHIFLGTAILILLVLNILTVKILFIIFLSGLLLALLSLRFAIPFVSWFLDKFERRSVFPGKGALFFFLGSILSLSLFPRDVALASIAVLTFGDSFAPLFGIYFGRIRTRFNGRRYLEGFIIGFLAALAASYFFVPLIPALLGSFVAMAFEFLEVRFRGYSIDDNIFIPLISGAVIYISMI